MKKIIIAMALITSIQLQAQITELDSMNYKHIGEIKGGRFLASMDYFTSLNDTTYLLSFRNHRHKVLKRVSVINFKNGKTLTELYNVFSEFMKDPSPKNRQFMLGETPITVMNHWGWSNLKLIIKTPYGYFKIKPDQLETLLGKKK